MSSIITVENLGKKYTISHQQREQYASLRDVITNVVASLGSTLIRPFCCSQSPIPCTSPLYSEDFWALKNVFFEIKQGDRIGIIGRNGAGKSTLLKILSRITEPTTGSIRIKGRVASLLEVGTGFHPELSGRENIYLNGAILGMSRQEIRSKFDEIVDFSEIEKFLDTPVKRYSSGMYVRLAFAVAAHLEPEILIVDEVLAVGDAAFQKKCLGKMEDVSTKEGRTVLFVSHHMGAVAQLCNKAILLNKGENVQTGSVQQVVNYYINQSSATNTGYEADVILRNNDIAIMKAQSFDSDGNPAVNFTHNQEIVLMIECKINSWASGAEIGVAVRDSKRKIFTTCTSLSVHGSIPNILNARVVIPDSLLRPGEYFFALAIYIPNQVIFQNIEDVFSIRIVDGGSKYAANDGLDYGCVFVDCKWSVAVAHPDPEIDTFL